MNIVFQISGGIGKCIAATAVCQVIKKNYPDSKLIVISGYPDVFINNPHVSKNFKFGETAYFYKDYIENKDFQLFIQDPYITTSFFKEDKHLINIWCDLFGLKYEGELPQVFLTKKEMQNYTQQISLEQARWGKPIFLLQSNGGFDANRKYGWARDLPGVVVNAVIEEFSKTHAILHVKREDQISYPNTTPVTTDFRKICALATVSERRLVIDSFLQHLLGALNLPAVACWVVNSPVVYGYDIHTHIIANKESFEPELRNSVFSKYDITGNEQEFPYNDEDEMFDVHEIIDTLKAYL
jgi:hypothetical protein